MLLQRCAPVAGKAQRFAHRELRNMQNPNAVGRFVFLFVFPRPVCCPVSRADGCNGKTTARCFPLVTLLHGRERQSDLRGL